MKIDLTMLTLTPQFLVAMGLATWMTWFPVLVMSTNLYKIKNGRH